MEITNLSAQIGALVRKEVQRQVSNNPGTSNIDEREREKINRVNYLHIATDMTHCSYQPSQKL